MRKIYLVKSLLINLDSEIRKMVAMGFCGNGNSTFNSGPCFTCHYDLSLTQLSLSEIELASKSRTGNKSGILVPTKTSCQQFGNIWV